MEKYVAVQEPTCTWAVFDAVEDVPAEFEGRVLVGLEKAEAMLFASAANARERSPAVRADATAVLRGIRLALVDDARGGSTELPLDEPRPEAEKTAARTWRNW